MPVFRKVVKSPWIAEGSRSPCIKPPVSSYKAPLIYREWTCINWGRDEPERAHIASTWDYTMNKCSEPQLVIPYIRTVSSQSSLPRPLEYRKLKAKALCPCAYFCGSTLAHAEYVCNQELPPCLQYGMPCMEDYYPDLSRSAAPITFSSLVCCTD